MNVPQITTTDKEINALVYKLYDLTDEEIKIVEGRWKERQFFLIWRNLKTMLS